jgi:hypothetical protein
VNYKGLSNNRIFIIVRKMFLRFLFMLCDYLIFLISHKFNFLNFSLFKESLVLVILEF